MPIVDKLTEELVKFLQPYIKCTNSKLKDKVYNVIEEAYNKGYRSGESIGYNDALADMEEMDI